MGGPGGEAEVSRNSAKSMATALDNLGVPYTCLEYTDTFIADIQALNAVDFVLIAMHGSPGEDGTVQQALENIGLPYNGSGVKASMDAMDKSLAKVSFAEYGLDVAKEYLVTTDILPESVHDFPLPMPFVIKPNDGGSSVGVFIVTKEDIYKEALLYFNPSERLLCEEFIAGQELTVTLMGERVLGVMEITSEGFDFYDYESKYSVGGSGHIYPAQIATDVQQNMEELALKAHNSLGCSGVTRVDFRYDKEQNRIVVLEVNTLPGMTSTSLVPDMAAHNGMSFEEVVTWIIEDALWPTQYEKPERKAD
jgi:D-alanine-D-alanine ligase